MCMHVFLLESDVIQCMNILLSFVIQRFKAPELWFSVFLYPVLIVIFDLPVHKGRWNLYLRSYSHAYFIFILMKSYINGCFLGMPECPLGLPNVKKQFRFQRTRSISSRKTFFPSFPETSRCIFSPLMTVLFLSGVCPHFAPVFSPCQEELFFFIRFSFQLSCSDEPGADRGCEDRQWQSRDGINTKASGC